MITSRLWKIEKPYQNTPAAVAFADLDAVFKLEGVAITSDSESLIFPITVAGCKYYVKRYHKAKSLRSWFGGARIQVEALNQLRFTQWGIGAAKVVAYGQNRFLTKTVQGALITESLDNTQDLAEMVHNDNPLLKNRIWMQKVLDQVALITQTLHKKSFVHNDLKWRNILVSQDNQNPKVYLIDCPSGRKLIWPLLHYRIIKDLACLDKVGHKQLSKTQRLRFFKSYLGCNQLQLKHKKMIAKIVHFFDGRS